jgi:branched-chain amino acid transport system substrate-binding protein
MISRRGVIATGGAALATTGLAWPARSEKRVIKIGNTNPYSGPAASYGVNGKIEAAYFRMINEQGGIDGHKIDFITLDDGYSPPKTVEQVRRLVEQDNVDFLFATLGTPTNSAIVDYVNKRKVPHLFVSTGASKWADYKKYPWTMGFQASYRTEGQIYAKYIMREKQNPRIGLLYQNDDFGKDYPLGVQDVLGADHDKYVVKSVSYETTDATIDSQIQLLRSADVDVLLMAAIPKFAAQAIRKVYDLNWKPLFVSSNFSISVGDVMVPAGPEKSVGMISTAYLKDPTDPAWANDPAMNEWRAFMAKYMPGSNLTDATYVYGYSASQAMVQVLRQCKGDFSRENVLRQAENLHDYEIPTLLPGIKLNTGTTEHRPIKGLQLARWDSKSWVRFGDVIEGVAT